MTEQTFSLASTYKGWDVYQQHLIHALAPLSQEQLALRSAPHLRSIEMTAKHIIGARARWLYHVLRERDESLVSLGTWDDRDQPARTAAELVSGLEATWQILQNALQRWTVADLEKVFLDIDEESGQEESFTRQWVLWHLIEHDLHHGGEISLALGIHHLPAIDL